MTQQLLVVDDDTNARIHDARTKCLVTEEMTRVRVGRPQERDLLRPLDTQVLPRGHPNEALLHAHFVRNTSVKIS